MIFDHVVELFNLIWVGLFVLIPAVAVNRRVDQVKQMLSPEELRRRTALEIDELYAWYCNQISRDVAVTIGAAYARYSTQKQESISDQLRKMFEYSIKLRIFIPREYVFFDTAVTGKKLRRIGLSQLEDVLRAKKVKTLFLFATNRLFRKTYRTLEFVDRTHKSWGIRCIFVASNVDTNDNERWEMLLHFHAMIDQFVVTMYADHIRAGHEGNFEKRLVFGTISYGYFGEIIEGEFTAKGKQRRRLKIDADTARIVAMIFHLFVRERLGLNEIARRLNDDPLIPLPPHCRSGRWTDDTVRTILKNTRYRGLWKYGVTEAIFLPEEDYVRQIPRLEPLKQAQIEELRIVDDELWFAAAQLLARNGHGHGGRKSKDGNHAIRPKPLNGLLHCAEHERPLVVAGANGRMMNCPVCQCMPAPKRPLRSWLNRRNALDLVCKELARRILEDVDLVDQVVDACRREAEPNPQHARGNVEALKARRDKLQRTIDFAMTNVGETPEDRLATARFVQDWRAEKSQVAAELSRLAAAREAKVEIPTRAEICRLLKDLSKLMTDAGQSDNASDRAVLRRLIEELTGGRIIVSQQGERKRQHGWLRGTFRLRLLSTVVGRISNGAVACDDEGVDVSIDFKRPLATDIKAEIAWQLHFDKKRNAEIAMEIGCCSSYVTRLLKIAAEKKGIKWIDGRSLRLNFPPENRQPVLYQRIVDQVMELYFKDVPLGEIAVMCNVHVATVRKARNWYFEQQGLKVPNGRARAGRIKAKRNRF